MYIGFQFNVSSADCRLFVAEDGTLVDDDDYLRTLPPQTLFILLKSTEKMVTGKFEQNFRLSTMSINTNIVVIMVPVWSDLEKLFYLLFHSIL